ncbi:histidine kinase [Undibacterium sp. CY18W]|uniref:Histidine kinase n=1 Tax=Undibacterium hunanense TaxID=2762292 RepID=A0ABR6ZXJ9_9BURK|nr:histidine kinase [Undibacterium hunanense]MBC3920587.1 histidine kinase [Undibacterium hunanense]
MFTTIWFILRASFGWSLLVLFSTIFIVNVIFRNHMPDEIIFLPITAVALVMGISFSHVRRVRLIASKVDAGTLANRQRRQIEIPLEASEAFELVDAAIRELPGAEDTDSAKDSLQIRAKIKRIDPYQANFVDDLKMLDFLTTKRNQILATITPGDGVGSLTLICEPERPAWTDLFLVDNGTNLENAEAVTRAITRRIAERRRKEKASAAQSVTEKELTVAKLNLLHAQVEPHFLYNTLASAQLLTRADPAAADQMLGNLITYLRHSLPRTEDTASSIGEELERSIAYLDIMKIRMGARLNIQIQVPAELKALPFPMMMLQTLVENAIKHGLEPKTGGGTIWIIARQHEGNVAVTVADDGNGLGAEIGGTGIGLKNVRERLRLAYANTASFVLVGNFPSGVAATITVPVIREKTADKGEQHA